MSNALKIEQHPVFTNYRSHFFSIRMYYIFIIKSYRTTA